MAVVTPEAPILPWPRILRQSWLNLSFLHWAVKPASIAHLYPPDTEPDTFDGSSFVGVVPFQMADTGFARGPAFFGTFLETNVRLYSVDRTGRRRAYRSTLRCGSPRVRRARRARQAAAGSRDVQRRPGGTIRATGAVDDSARRPTR